MKHWWLTYLFLRILKQKINFHVDAYEWMKTDIWCVKKQQKLLDFKISPIMLRLYGL